MKRDTNFLKIPINRIIALAIMDIMAVVVASFAALYIRFDFSFQEIPEEYMKARLAEVEYSTAMDNFKYGQTLEEFLETQGTDLETERAAWELTLSKQIKTEFILQKAHNLPNF